MKLKTRLVYQYNRLLKHFIKFQILNNDESINEMLNSDKSLARYGDGEMLIINKGYINFQKYDDELAKRLEEILKTEDENILIGVPIAIKSTDGYNKKAKDFWDRNMDTGRMHWNRLCNKKKVYCNTNMTRLFRDYESKKDSERWFENFRKLWEKKNVLLVEGSESKLGFNNDLFANAKSVKRIIAPSKDAYDKYKDILSCIKMNCKDKLVVMSLGPTATVLAYDLYKLGIRAVDIGHIQLEYSEFLDYKRERGLLSMKKILLKDEYENQIIARV